MMVRRDGAILWRWHFAGSGGRRCLFSTGGLSMAALSYRILFCFSICLLGFSSSQAAEFYVSTTGDDNIPGTLSQPFASLDRGQQAASPGDTVWIRGGVYDYVAGPGASEHAVLV